MIRADFHDHRDGDIYVEWFDNKDEMMELAKERYRECNIYVDRCNDKCYIVTIDDWEY